MAQSRDTSFNPSSPHSSSGGVESFRGTPDTRLTAFSPEEGSTKSAKLLKSFPRSASATPPVRLPVNSFRGPVSHLDKDPFVSPTPVTRLSPTASAFSPVSNAVGLPLLPGTHPIERVLSSDPGISHVVNVTSAQPLSASDIDAHITGLVEAGSQFYGSREIKGVDGGVRIQFSDIRDARTCYSSISTSANGWKAHFLHGTENLGSPEKPAQPGQVEVWAALSPGSAIESGRVIDTVMKILQSCGQLLAFVPQLNYADGSCRAIATFAKPDHAIAASKTCNGVLVEGIYLTIAPPKQNSVRGIDDALQSIALTAADREQAIQQSPHARVSGVAPPTPFPVYPYIFPGALGPSMPYVFDRLHPASQVGAMPSLNSPYPLVGHLYQAPPSPALTAHQNFSPSRTGLGYGRLDVRRQHATRVTRAPYHNAATHHNHVDIGRIRDGIDVRTTIMLRNIPNKVDQAMLKRIIDESSWGKYDFMYLRIDFANNCNVGYAFINFVDPLDIIDFVNARGNQRWNCFKSDKVAEVSYATIQGKDCLVQKFRNSSVMLEAAHYRPKLFFTSNGPMPELAGQEEPFPEPDNQSKMKRSCENAEHVGLFTPNAGQHFRDEQRRRRSQYDRGTRLAALEEYDYETAIQHLYGPATQ